MKARTLTAVLITAAALMTGCSSTSSNGDAQAAANSGSQSPASGTSSGSRPSDSTSTAASGSAGPGGSADAVCSGTSSGGDKPVATLLARTKPPIDAGGRWSSDSVPKACAAWIKDVSTSDDNGKPLVSNEAISMNLTALVDEAAKTQDVDSLVKLCYLDCDQLPTLMPAKDASGRTGFERLSELLEKTHPAEGYAQSPTVVFPGFSANHHGALTAFDRQDMKLLGVSTQNYSGLRTGFVEDFNADSSTVGWDATSYPNN